MKLVLKIAAGVLLAGIITFAARAAYLSYAAHVATEALREAVAEQQERAAKIQAEGEEQASLKRLQEQRAREAARKRSQERAKKLRAWNDYYVAPKGCEIFKSDSHMVECINHKMRAKGEFEKLYESGGILST
jgi:fumarylacetoacetate (FAA) hydrolase family protein